MKHQILIASYRKDFGWLRQCLRSIEKFGTGFGDTIVAFPGEDTVEVEKLAQQLHRDGVRRVGFKIWDGPGFGRAQDAMMSGDKLCLEADYVWLLGSDCLAVDHFSPATYSGNDGRPFMLYNTWEHMRRWAPETCFWRAGVEKALGWESRGEFMRRLPLAYPVSMLAPMRDFITRRHGVPFNSYVWDNVNRVKNFSESNVMGEWAWRHAQDAYNWVLLDNGEVPGFQKWPTNPIVQHWSHGGIDRPRDQDKRTPREVIIQALGSL